MCGSRPQAPPTPPPTPPAAGPSSVVVVDSPVTGPSGGATALSRQAADDSTTRGTLGGGRVTGAIQPRTLLG